MDINYVATFGPYIGLILYILVHDLVPFLKDRFWPAIREDRKETIVLRRESDAKLLDLEERKVVAQEQVAKNLILLTERTSKLENEVRRHDDHMMSVMAQMTTTLSGLNSMNTILLDRVLPRPSTQETKGE